MSKLISARLDCGMARLEELFSRYMHVIELFRWDHCMRWHSRCRAAKEEAGSSRSVMGQGYELTSQSSTKAS